MYYILTSKKIGVDSREVTSWTQMENETEYIELVNYAETINQALYNKCKKFSRVRVIFI